MGRQTRSSAPASPTKSSVPAKNTPLLIDEDPHKLYLVPENASKDARFLFLKHPCDGSRCQFFFCPEQGLFEITKVNSPYDPRSILFTSSPDSDPESQTSVQNEVYVNKAAEICIATPFNPVYILLPLLDPSIDHSEGDMLDRRQFHSFESYLEEPQTQDRHLHYILSDSSFRPRLMKALNDVCDAVEVGDDQMYRLNFQRLSSKISKSALNIAKNLPASLEDRFVTRALEPPLIPESEKVDLPAGEALEQIHRLQRMRTAETLIKTSYLRPAIASKISFQQLPDPIDFAPLDAYLETLAKMRTAALASRSMADFKRRNIEDEDAAEDRVAKKRRLEEEEKKKKAQESRGVRDLKKVDVSGMKKMSDFFSKKAPAAKPKK